MDQMKGVALPQREPISTAVYRLLREAILQSQFRPGERINELELAGAWNISRTPIRDALRRLQAEGLVEVLPRRGVAVTDLRAADVRELYVLREALEGMAARLAAENADPSGLGQLNVLIKAYGAALKQGDFERLVTIDDELHRTVALMAGNSRLARVIETTRAQLTRIRVQTARLHGRATKSFREMATLTAAIRARNGTKGEQSMRAHIASLRADAEGVLEEWPA